MNTCHSEQEIFELYLKHRQVCTDTRKIVPGSIFFALKGENFDANTFARDAIAKGCAHAVVDNPAYAGDRCLLVKDSLETLRKVAILYRQSLAIPVIGITGTNGKTTTKELVRSVLSVRFKVFATQGNLNNHIGVPLSLLSIPEGTQMAIIEMGANHPGEIAGLCKVSKPTFGIITNVGKAHLEGFGSFENIVKTKTALYEAVRQNGGKVFVSEKSRILMNASQGMERFLYGESNEVYLRMSRMESPDAYLSCLLHAERGSGKTEVHTHLVGFYNIENVSTAACAGRYFGLNDEEIKQGLENYVPTNLRSQSIQAGGNTLIADTYNANPTSMEAAVENFAALSCPGRKTAVLGDMLELGSASETEHQHVVELLAAHDIPEAFLIGNCFAKTKRPENFHSFISVDELLEHLQRHPLTQRCVLIKGSHGIHLEKAVEFLQKEAR
ncbi:MAG: UDP-N-acetylmuramoyl-tripeptide--D-alanyl-D-alanine ligase [Bacteroides sp.]|nr:UDP-N-acetylmuramoyl-tripeptide--D-alanyl-D-alanine ligase [Ruminococcus flavefaciens]MCM1554966.1 UDP-N-acetylmuramoyl-tripeptide--D-alanyl-D-alanine ligase [Bacteroides sp.]